MLWVKSGMENTWTKAALSVPPRKFSWGGEEARLMLQPLSQTKAQGERRDGNALDQPKSRAESGGDDNPLLLTVIAGA